MHLLLIHQNFPAQFLPLLPVLVEAGHQLAAIGSRPLPNAVQQRYPQLLYESAGGNPAAEQPFCQGALRHQAQWEQGERVAKAAAQLKARGWRPDVIAGHPFWGCMLQLHRIFPGVPQVPLLELDLHGLTGTPALDQWAELLAIRAMAHGLCSTPFQHSTYPADLHARICVIHEGIDTERCRPRPLARLDLGQGTVLDGRAPLISFASRHLEPLRGFDTFMRALPSLLNQHPHLQVVICGRDDQGYGPPPSDGSSWREQMLIELGPRLDLQRVHVVGLLPHDQLLELFRLSWVHVYASEPWVLSWSVLEAMACGVALVATDTPAIRDVVTSGRDGVLVPRRDPEALASAITALLHAPHCTAPLRSAARRRILDGFDQRQCSRQRLKLLEAVVAGRRP
jgi:glycosyltransferase involved in cell wall biosynthesis